MIACFMLALLITACSTATPSTTYLPAELEQMAREDAMAFYTTKGLDRFRLDRVSELTINDIRNPGTDSAVDSGEFDHEMWCFTTVARGRLDGIPREVSMQWFGIKEEGKDWVVMPRHIIAYPAFWDRACDEAERLDP